MAVVADSRSLRSGPTAWVRGIDGGKLVKSVKLFAVCAAALQHDIHVSVSPGGTREGRFLPNGIRWSSSGRMAAAGSAASQAGD